MAMVSFVLAIVLLLLALVVVVLEKTYYYLPARELKRRAEQHDPLSEVLWRAVGYGSLLKLLLWSVVVVTAGVGFGLLTQVAPTPLAMIAVGLLLLLAFAWLPNTRLTSFGGRLTVWCTPAVVWLLQQLSPVLRAVQRPLRRFAIQGHTGLFEPADMLEMLERQKHQSDNRISETELAMLTAALQFDSRRVRDIVVPRKAVKAVAASEDVGPITLDELYKTRHACFPVYGSKRDDFVGLLYLRDLVETEKSRSRHKGTIADCMQAHVAYVHESDSLSEALHTFYQTKLQLFIVVNSFNEYVGIVTLADVISQLLGQPTVQALEQPDSREAVAARHSAQPVKSEEPAPKPAEPPAVPEPQAVPSATEE